MSDAPAPAPVAENAAPAPIAEAPAPAVQPDKPAASSQPATTTSWRDSLPDDIKGSPSLAKFETIEGLAKSYANLERMIGSEKIPVPKTEEDYERWYKAGGRPDTPDGYEFKPPEQVPEGMIYDEGLDKRLADIAHKRGLNKHQAAGMREDLMGILAEGGAESLNAVKAREQQEQQAAAEAETSLKGEWGRAYEQNAKIAGRAINQLFGPELTALFESKGLGNHPALIKAAHQMGTKLIGEKQLIGEGFTEQTPADLERAIADHASKYRTELMDKQHPDHVLRVKERSDLFTKRYG